MNKKIDLHIHTTCSDGVLSPKEIIDEAYKNDVKIISITDHDSIDAYTQELYDYAKLKNIKIINGVEISTKIDKGLIHVLGYNFDINNEKLKEKLNLLRNARHDYLFKVADKLKKIGYIVNVDILDKIKSVTKAHIATDIINNSENVDILLKDFNKIPNKGEFIETIMNKGCPGYVKKETITPKEASLVIKEAGGKVILAHPVAYEYQKGLTVHDILEIIKEMEPDGIEANYIYVDVKQGKIDEVNKWNKIAKENNLITSLGSDFHNKDGIYVKIGLTDENLNLSNEEIDNIINNLLI